MSIESFDYYLSRKKHAKQKFFAQWSDNLSKTDDRASFCWINCANSNHADHKSGILFNASINISRASSLLPFCLSITPSKYRFIAFSYLLSLRDFNSVSMWAISLDQLLLNEPLPCDQAEILSPFSRFCSSVFCSQTRYVA